MGAAEQGDLAASAWPIAGLAGPARSGHNREVILLHEIPQLLAQLRRLDPKLRIFGAAKHRYLLEPMLAEPEVARFEREHDVPLPAEYRAFVTAVGNGGAGPDYALLPLAAWRTEGGEQCLRKVFPHAGAWGNRNGNAGEAGVPEADGEYGDAAQVDGAIVISDAGCGIAPLLVVTGPERGHVWVDDRCSENGIYPLLADEQDGASRVDFHRWYSAWLVGALAEAQGRAPGRIVT